MPGKVNPVMPELMNEVCYKVMGNDVTVTIASQNGLLQLNAYEPVVAIAIMESQAIFYKTMPLFRKNCIDGITANEDVLKHYMDRSVGIVTALNPVLGYEKTTELAKEALQTNKGILELIREKKLLTEDQIKKLTGSCDHDRTELNQELRSNEVRININTNLTRIIKNLETMKNISKIIRSTADHDAAHCQHSCQCAG